MGLKINVRREKWEEKTFFEEKVWKMKISVLGISEKDYLKWQTIKKKENKLKKQTFLKNPF